MKKDPVAVAFAKWVDAHKRHVDAQQRLGAAQQVAGATGTRPPHDLAQEVRRLQAESDRLLALAQHALRGQRRVGS